MRSLPRLAIGAVHRDIDLRPALWALLAAQAASGRQVQQYLSQASFGGYLEGAAITGVKPRHLDSWLMSAEMCRETFQRTAVRCDLAIVAGEFQTPPGGKGGCLNALCRWLDLPRLGVLDLAAISACCWPPRPDSVDALLLDRVPAGQGERMATEVETLWRLPVLGVLEELPSLRAAVTNLAEGVAPAADVYHDLGYELLRCGRLRGLMRFAARQTAPWSTRAGSRHACCGAPVIVAVAYDEALNCYFPETLDALESGGATLVDFSPLRDDRLPPQSDIVYLGGGHPERFAATLAQNHCMKLALAEHLRNGGRLLAEGGGLAYLCEELATSDGTRWPMTGILPAVAHHRPGPLPPEAVEAHLGRPTWLGHPGTVVRGYRPRAWRIEPRRVSPACAPAGTSDLMGTTQTVGSRLHVELAAQPHLLAGFFQPTGAASTCRKPTTNN
jgi:cobyrinic acid a,c-diamide synthase